MKIDKKGMLDLLGNFIDKLNASLDTRDVHTSYAWAVALREHLKDEAQRIDEVITSPLRWAMLERSKKETRST